jgi:hypothetical protein
MLFVLTFETEVKSAVTGYSPQEIILWFFYYEVAVFLGTPQDFLVMVCELLQMPVQVPLSVVNTVLVIAIL